MNVLSSLIVPYLYYNSRRISAAMKSCSVCHGLDLKAGGHETSYSTKTQFQNLRLQKEQGCVTCSFLLEGLENFKNSWESIDKNIISIYLYKEAGRCLEVYLGLPYTTLKFECFTTNGEWTIKLLRLFFVYLLAPCRKLEPLGLICAW
jgi:hypothetical protein